MSVKVANHDFMAFETAKCVNLQHSVECLCIL